MKQYSRALIYLFILYCFLGSINVFSQNNQAASYLGKVDNYAALYRGEIEYFYNPYIYKSQPYYISGDFVTGDLYYDGKYYPKQRLRLDNYKGQLLILTPKNQSIILDFRKFEKARIHEKEIISHYPPEVSGLKTGYYISLYDGERIMLLGKEKYNFRILPSQIEYIFDRSMNYYLIYNEKYHSVKNKRSFTRLFPEFKKQINQFSKREKLDFRERREYSLAMLSEYCDQLTNSQTDLK